LPSGKGIACVFIGSLGSSIAIPRAVAYVASKAGLLGLVRTLAAEWATLGVRVNAISPGYFRTELTAAVLDRPLTTSLPASGAESAWGGWGGRMNSAAQPCSCSRMHPLT
jgi:NAD(P)-dependent dehydrogenase (short-subunit alcohol dehydrogenase family)